MSIKPPISIPYLYTTNTPVDYISSGVWTGLPYRWQLGITITPQTHSDDTSPTPFQYNGLDARVGDWLLTDSGTTVQIISIVSANTTTNFLDCIVEDIQLYNINSDVNVGGSGLPSQARGVIFRTDDEGKPVIDPVSTGNLTPYNVLNALSRFQYTTSAFFVSALSQLTNDTGYITQASANAAYQPLGSVSALSQLNNDAGYVTVNTATSVLSQLVNDAGYVSAAQFTGGGIVQITVSGTQIRVSAPAPDIQTDRITGYSANSYVFASAPGGNVVIGSGGFDVITITPSGNVGIGTNNPTGKLDIYEASAQSSFIQLTTVNTGVSADSGVVLGIPEGTTDFTINNRENGVIALSNNGIEGLVITSAGDTVVQKLTVSAEGGSYSLPVSGGTANQVLLTDGSGNSRWVSVVGGGFIDVNVTSTEIRVSAATVDTASALSQFNNDVGYITQASAQTLINNAGFITGVETSALGGGAEIALGVSAGGSEILFRSITGTGGVEVYTSAALIKISAAPNPINISQLNNDAGYITQNSANGAYQAQGSLSALSQFNNDAGYITVSTATSVISQLVNDAGYVSAAQFTGGGVIEINVSGNEIRVSAATVTIQVQATNIGAGEGIAIGTSGAETTYKTILGAGGVEVTGTLGEIVISAAPNPVNLSELNNDSGFITESSANAAYQAAGSLSALSQFNNDANYITVDTATSVISQLVNDAGYITEASANASYEIVGNLSALSQFSNDVGYITQASAQALVNAVNQVSALSQLNNDAGYITQNSANAAYQAAGSLSALSQFNNDVGYITQSSAQTLINAINQVSATSQLTNDSGYITVSTATSVISQLVNDAGYVSAAQFTGGGVINITVSGSEIRVSAATVTVQVQAEQLGAGEQLVVATSGAETTYRSIIGSGSIEVYGTPGEVVISAAPNPVNLSELNNDTGYITQNSANAAYQATGSLSALSQFNNDAGYITVSTATSVISQLVNDAGYVSAAQFTGGGIVNITVSGNEIRVSAATPDTYLVTTTALGIGELILSNVSAPMEIAQKALVGGGIIEISTVGGTIVVSAAVANQVSALSQLANDTDYITNASAQTLFNSINQVSAVAQLINDAGFITATSAEALLTNLSALGQFINNQGFVSAAQFVGGGVIDVTVSGTSTGQQIKISAASVSVNVQANNVGTGEIIAVATSGAETTYRSIRVAGAIQLSATPIELVLSAAPNPTALSQLTNDVGYITQASAQTLINAINQVSATSQLTNDSGYITVSTATSVISQLVNDAGYVSAAQFTGGGIIQVNVSGNEIRLSAASTQIAVQASALGGGSSVVIGTSANETRYRTFVGSGSIQVSAGATEITLSAPTVNLAPYITQASANLAYQAAGSLSSLSQFTNTPGFTSAAQFVGAGIIQVRVSGTGAGQQIIVSAASTQVAVQASSLGTGIAFFTGTSANETRYRTITGGGGLEVSARSDGTIVVSAPPPAASGVAIQEMTSAKGTGITTIDFRTISSNTQGVTQTVSATGNTATVTTYVPQLYSFRINAGAATGVDAITPVDLATLPAGWTVASATSTTVSLYHNVGRRHRHITVHGYTVATGYRSFGGAATVYGMSLPGSETTQIRINIGSPAAALSENNGHYIIELLF